MARSFWEVVAELAAIAGLDPWPWSLRELHAAATAKQMDAWNRMAVGTAWVVNAAPNFGKSPRPTVQPWNINPLSNQAIQDTHPALVRAKLKAWARRSDASG